MDSEAHLDNPYTLKLLIEQNRYYMLNENLFLLFKLIRFTTFIAFGKRLNVIYVVIYVLRVIRIFKKNQCMSGKKYEIGDVGKNSYKDR